MTEAYGRCGWPHETGRALSGGQQYAPFSDWGTRRNVPTVAQRSAAFSPLVNQVPSPPAKAVAEGITFCLVLKAPS